MGQPGTPIRARSYADYLHLGELLGAQHPLSVQHDEMLFIVMHQVAELWMKLALGELRAARELVRRDRIAQALALLARVALVQQQLLQSWDVFATLSPLQFAAFREALGTSSGFQSAQYRLLEFLLGHRSAAALAAFRAEPASLAALEQEFAEPGLYDEVLRHLAREGIAVPGAVLARDVTQPYQSDPGVEAAWLGIYRGAQRHWDLYQLGERLVDIDHRFQLWRHAHMKTADRIIGNQAGSGGTSGVSYLSRTLDLKFFPELWAIRTSL
jgi:tryptophan 2,3-dioxygenase